MSVIASEYATRAHHRRRCLWPGLCLLFAVLSGCASNTALRSNVASNYDGLVPWVGDDRQQVISSERLPLPSATAYRIADCSAAGAAIEFAKANPKPFGRICTALIEALHKQLDKRSLHATSADDSTAAVLIEPRVVAVTKHNVVLNVITGLAAVPVSNGGLSVELEASDQANKQQIALMVWGRNGNALTQGFILPSFDSVVDAKKLARRAAKDFAELLRPLPPKHKNTRR